MINMDTEKDYGEAHLNPLQRQNMRIFIEATKSLMDSVGEEGLSIRKIAAKAGYNSATIYNYFQDLDELMLFGSVSFFRDVFQKVLEGRTDDMTWKDRYIYFFRSLASVSFRKPTAFYNMFYGPHSEELGRIMRVYFNQLYPEELNGIDAGFAQVMREGILVNKYRLLFTNLLREENYTEEVEEITPVLLNSLYHTFLHEAIKRGKDFDVEQKAAYFVNLVKTILDGSVIISNYQKEHD